MRQQNFRPDRIITHELSSDMLRLPSVVQAGTSRSTRTEYNQQYSRPMILDQFVIGPESASDANSSGEHAATPRRLPALRRTAVAERHQPTTDRRISTTDLRTYRATPRTSHKLRTRGLSIVFKLRYDIVPSRCLLRFFVILSTYGDNHLRHVMTIC